MRDFSGVPGASGGNADDDTVWTPAVGNSIVQEISNVVRDEAGGDADLNPADNTQLLTAIQAMINRAVGGAIDGETIVVGSKMIKNPVVFGSFTEATYLVAFATPFPNALDGAPVATLINTSGTIEMDSEAQIVSYDRFGVYVKVQRDATAVPNANGISVWARGH